MKKLVRLAAAAGASLAALASCGDNNSATPPDAAPVEPDAASPDGPAPFVPPVPFAVPLAAAGPDQLQSATAAPSGAFYAAGFAGASLTAPRFVTIVKIAAAGGLDQAFGTDGKATTTLDFRGGAGEIGIATQPSGKIVVSATVASPSDATDRDVAVIRLNTNGQIDTTFGDNGIRVLDLNTAHNNGTMLVGLDAARGIGVDSGGRIYVLAASRGVGTATGGGPRIDTDFTVARLTVDGAPDATWNGGTANRLDIQESNATPRGLRALADGSVIVGGYASSPGVGSTQPVVYKLKSTGELDSAWGNGGVFHEVVLAVQTEVYNFAVHTSHLVTGGYGRNSGTTNDFVSMRFDLATGARDLAWGGAPNGAVLVDPSGTKAGSNCRNSIALPGGKTALIGSTGPTNMPAQDATVVILDADGRVDAATYGGGILKFPLGANGNDQFWGGAVSGSAAMFVGYKGGGATPTETTNDDAFAVILPLR